MEETQTKEKPKKVQPLGAPRMQQAEEVRRVWSIISAAGTPREHLTEPSYWAHVARDLRPWDRIEVRADDGTFFGELLVRDAGVNWAKVAVLFIEDLVPVGYRETKFDGFTVKYIGTSEKWAVIRDSDKAPVRSGIETQEQAVAWLSQNKQSLAA